MLEAQMQSWLHRDTPYIASIVYHPTDDPMCKLCVEKQDNDTYVINGCKMLSQRESIKHDIAEFNFGWVLLQKEIWLQCIRSRTIQSSGRRKPNKVSQGLQTDRVIEHQKSDIVFFNATENCLYS